MQNQSNPRFNEYTEIIKNNQVLGFKLDDNDFQFIFDKFGGWYDEQGTYYNADAIQSQPPENQSDQDSQPQDKNQKEQITLEQKLIQLNINNTNNDRIQVMRNFEEILETYPQNQQIRITFSLQPQTQNESQIVEQFINSKIQQKITVKDNLICDIFDQELAAQIIELQGSTIEKQNKKLTLYIYVDLYDSIDVSIKMQKSQLEFKLNELCYEKNSDYANITEQKEGQEIKSYFQIRRDIASQLKEDIDYQLQSEQ